MSHGPTVAQDFIFSNGLYSVRGVTVEQEATAHSLIVPVGGTITVTSPDMGPGPSNSDDFFAVSVQANPYAGIFYSHPISPLVYANQACAEDCGGVGCPDDVYVHCSRHLGAGPKTFSFKNIKPVDSYGRFYPDLLYRIIWSCITGPNCGGYIFVRVRTSGTYARVSTRGPRRIPAVNQRRFTPLLNLPIPRGYIRVNLRGVNGIPPNFRRRNIASTRNLSFPNTVGTVSSPPTLSYRPATAIVSGGGVTSIAVNTSPIYIPRTYRRPPTVTITGGGGSGATAIVTLGPTGGIVSITVTNPGSGYTTPPTVIIDPIDDPIFTAPIGTPTNTGINLNANGSETSSQYLDSELQRFYNSGRKYNLYQSEGFTSNLTKRKKLRVKELQENPTLRLAGAPLISFGIPSSFHASPVELMTTTFTYKPSSSLLDSAKKDVGKKWLICDFADFQAATEAELLEYMKNFNILDEDFSTAGDAQTIVMIGFVTYSGDLQDGGGNNYCLVYCNKSVPSTLTPLESLHSGYWVLVTTNEIEAKILCKK